MRIEILQGVHLRYLVAVVSRLLLREEVLPRFLHYRLDVRSWLLLSGCALGLRQVEAACLGLLPLSCLILFLDCVKVQLLRRLRKRAGTASHRILHLLGARSRYLHGVVEGVVAAAGQQVLLLCIMTLLLAFETMLGVLLVEIRLIYGKLPVFHSK